MQYASLISVESPRRGCHAARRIAPHAARSAPASRSPPPCSPRAAAAAAPTSKQIPGTPNSGPTSNYNGPPPSTPDVQQFKINLWDNVQANNRCGTCHSDTGGQAPMFARRDDINLAYAAANGVVTLSSPQDSTMVGKVGGGHNCWLASNAACGDILTTWITNWAGSTAVDGGAQDRARAAGAARPRPEQELPGRPGRAVLDDRVSGARAALLRVPCVGHGAEAAAVLRRRPAERRRRRSSSRTRPRSRR